MVQNWGCILDERFQFSKQKTPSAAILQPKREWQRRQQVDKRAIAALADVVFPRKRHALFRELVDMGEDIKDLLYREVRVEGSQYIGRRYWAAAALSRVQAGCSGKAVHARLASYCDSQKAANDDSLADAINRHASWVDSLAAESDDLAAEHDSLVAHPDSLAARLASLQSDNITAGKDLDSRRNRNCIDCCVDCAISAAEMFDPTRMDVRSYVTGQLDMLGEQLRERLGDTHPGSLQALKFLCSLLLEPAGATAAPRLVGNRESFYSPRNSLLHKVLQTGQGIPITLSLILAAVAGRAGMRIELIESPKRFLTRFLITEGPSEGEDRWICSFEGRILNRDQAIELVMGRGSPAVSSEDGEFLLLTAQPGTVTRRIVHNMLNAIFNNHPAKLDMGVAAMRFLCTIDTESMVDFAPTIAEAELTLANVEAAQEMARHVPHLSDLQRRITLQLQAQQDAEDSRFRKSGLKFRVGDIVRHVKYGYRGLIWGWDTECRASPEWVYQMGINSLPRGSKQPFYQTLVDCRDRPGDQSTYVAQENLEPLPREASQSDEDYLIDNQQVGELFEGITAGYGRYTPNRFRASLFPQDM